MLYDENGENTTELPEELEQALQSVLENSDIEEITEAFAVLKKVDDPSYQRILVDRLETFSSEYLSTLKEEMDNLPLGNYTPANLVNILLKKLRDKPYNISIIGAYYENK